MKKLNILHAVEFYYPSVGGAQEVVRQLSEHLVMLGHSVTVATTKLPDRKSKIINGVKIVEFDVHGNEVRGYTGTDIKKYQDFLVRSKFDIIMNYAAQQWTSDLAFEVIDKIKARKVFVPCGYSGLYDPSYKDYFLKLPNILSKYDNCVYLSDDYRDINFARDNKLSNSIVIPNGADEREFDKLPKINKQEFLQQYNIPNNNKILLCVSNHTGQKGHKETIESFNKANIKKTSLVLIGDVNHYAGCYNNCVRSSKFAQVFNFFSRKNKTIHVLHISREETIKFYSICDLFIFLSNIECSPLVLFESAAAGKPFISSGCGNAREIANWTGSGVIVKSKQDKKGYTSIGVNATAVELEKILSSPQKLNKLGLSGRKAWKRKYSWASISKQYEKIYRNSK